jgi:uncharacterized protein YwgA
MENLSDVLVYIFSNYPNPLELSKARIVKMVYLADWKSAIEHGRQITGIRWHFNHYGPYVTEVINTIKSDSRFETTWVSNHFGEPKELISLISQSIDLSLSQETKEILDFVIRKTSVLYWQDFINLIYSTYPIQNSPRYSYLNLVSLAKDYKEKSLVSA